MKYVSLQDSTILNPEDGKPLLVYECAKCRRGYRAFYRPRLMPLKWSCECGAVIVADDPQLRALPVR